jgi:chlorite dismutase
MDLVNATITVDLNMELDSYCSWIQLSNKTAVTVGSGPNKTDNTVRSCHGTRQLLQLYPAMKQDSWYSWIQPENNTVVFNESSHEKDNS